ncbi:MULTISPECIES: signal peptidase I [Niastella]|uniref:Signal peptidase I n=1 Tax=Niastella soli TaxID=2821487 RepID=A0ABS3Z375_9BACT|nr:signal peptidase I [Niastella soli]MBO9203846.1 signal peptidase I [Niastella soli]
MKIDGKVALRRMGYIVLWSVIVLFALRLCFFDMYRIPSSSMKNKLKRGDYIFVNKTNYGGYLSGLFRKLSVTDTPHLNEIYVFTIKKEMPGFFVKRCIGLPGSGIEIENGVVKVDGKAVVEPLSVRHYYKIWYNDLSEVNAEIKRANIDKFENSYRKFGRYVFIALDQYQKEKLKKGIDSITRYNILHDSDRIVVKEAMLKENSLDMPLLIIPSIGMKVYFDQQDCLFYENAIRCYEDTSFHRSGAYCYIKGKRVDSYIFKRNYLFMMGDNRDIAVDSRRYGLIPEENLVGKYMFCL